MTPDQIATAFARLQAANPEPESDLRWTNPFTLLVAVVLSAQSTDAGVNKATATLFSLADTPEAMLALGEDRIRDAIRTLGLFNAKARHVLELSRILVEQHQGRIPDTLEALTALPGVGRKTANVVLNIAFAQPTMAVDTHIFRVANRTRIAPGRTPAKVEQGLLARIPPEFLRHAHHWLILHGRYVCKARKPDCPLCPIQDLCPWPSLGDPPELLSAKPPITVETEADAAPMKTPKRRGGRPPRRPV